MITQTELEKFTKLMENPSFMTFISTYNLVLRVNQSNDENHRVWAKVSVPIEPTGVDQRSLQTRADMLVFIMNCKSKYFVGDIFQPIVDVWFQDPEQAVLFKLKFS